MTNLNTSLGMTSPRCKMPCHGPAYSILNFAGQARQAKGLFKNINGQINVSGLLVFHQLVFVVNLP